MWVVKTVPARAFSTGRVEVETVGLDELADPLDAEEAGVALVGVEDLGRRCAGDLAVPADGADAADAEQELLEQPVVGRAAVQTVGDVTQRLRVLLDVGVHQQQRHSTDLRDPDVRDELEPAGYGDR